jgi:hypothetical protein
MFSQVQARIARALRATPLLWVNDETTQQWWRAHQ